MCVCVFLCACACICVCLGEFLLSVVPHFNFCPAENVFNPNVNSRYTFVNTTFSVTQHRVLFTNDFCYDGIPIII